MPETQSKETTCDLRLALLRYGGVHTWYDAKVGMKRRFVLSGRIDDPYLSPGNVPYSPHFHNKAVRLEISSPPDPEWLANVVAMLGVADSFGVVWVNAGVEPKRLEYDDETVEVEAIRVKVEMDSDAFEAIRRQAAEAYDHRCIMWAKVSLLGGSLPEPQTKVQRAMGVNLQDLDVSKDREYAVGGFEIFDTIYTDHLRGRVLSVERGRGEGDGVSISILLTEARYDLNIERAYIHSISCEGRVINGRGKPYDGAGVTVDFGKHEPGSETNELPERALSGEFGYWPKRPDKDYSSTHFWFDLKHGPDDAREVLIPLLTQEIGTQVTLSANLMIEEEELLKATDELRGNVRYYSFKVRRHLINDSALHE